MFSVKWVTGFVALFIILTFGSLIALFPAALFKEHVCPVAEHVLPSVVNDDTSLGTSGIGALGEGREASHHTGASAYLALIACFFFLLSSVFILSRMSIVAWCMELCGEVEFGMEYESEEEQNAFDDGGNGSIDPLKEREEGRGPVDAGGHGPGGRRARLESIVVYDPAGMKSNAGHDFESISSCAVLADFIREKALKEIDSSIQSRIVEERTERGRLRRLEEQYNDRVEQLERQLETLQRRREAKEKKQMKEREAEEGDPAEGTDMRSQQERDCEVSLEGAKQIIILAQQEYECREEVLQKLAMYEEKLKV
ncbi:hypothetical protein FOZ62_004760, partial [Perkinsus olseni]